MGRTQVSEEMRRHPLVAALMARLGNRLLFTTGTVTSGYFKADTTDSRDRRGFSLQVRRRDRSGQTVSVMAIRAGEHLVFPTRRKLIRCLPGDEPEIEAYMRLVRGLDTNVDGGSDNAAPLPRLSEVLDAMLARIDDWVSCLQPLAE